MKNTCFKNLFGITLGFVLLAAAAPFAAHAQSGAEPAAPGEIMLIVDGVFDGRGVFVFEKDTIRYRNESSEYPKDVTINGLSWDDLEKPFGLGFTPDFDKATLLEKRGRDPVRLTRGAEKFELLIDDYEPDSSKYMVRIGAKNQVPHDDIPLELLVSVQDETPPADDSARNGTSNTGSAFGLPGPGMNRNGAPMFGNPFMRPVPDEPTDGKDHPSHLMIYPVITPPLARTPDANPSPAAAQEFKPEQKIVIRGMIDHQAGFQIRENTVSYLNYTAAPPGVSGPNAFAFDGKFPSGVTMNGKAWSNLYRPYTLNVPLKEPSVRNAEFRGDSCKFVFRKNSEIAEVLITNETGKPAPFEVVLFLDESDFVKERKIILEGTFAGQGAFIFEGNTIHYRHEDREYPASFSVNGKRWNLRTPFELPFQIDTAHPEVVQTSGNKQVRLNRISDERFEVYFEYPGVPSGSSGSRYIVQIAPKKQPETK